MGAITELATSAPGYSAVRPEHAAPLAETLLLNGYSTAQFGKCHEVPVWQTSPMGPFDQWPTRQRLRVLLRLHRRRDQPVLPGHLRGHHADRAADDPGGGLPLHRGHDRQGHRLGPPAEGARCPTGRSSCTTRRGPPTRPHQVPTEWADRYRGRFDDGWDVLREEIFARQKELGRDPGRRRAHRPAERDPGLRRHARGAEAGPGAGRWRSTPASSSTPTTTSAGCIDTLEDLDDPRRHARSTTSSATTVRQRRGHDQRHASTRCSSSTALPALETPEFLIAAHRRASAAPTAYNHYAVGLGARDVHARTSGPSRSPRTGAGPATAPSCTGPTGSRPRARSATSSTTSSTSPPPCSRSPGFPSPTFVNGIQQMPHARA